MAWSSKTLSVKKFEEKTNEPEDQSLSYLP
jgi:hypothetical protein